MSNSRILGYFRRGGYVFWEENVLKEENIIGFEL